jgi:hypothetical protein
MPKLGLGLSLPQTRVAGGFTPKKLSGLNLWLDAAKVSPTAQNINNNLLAYWKFDNNGSGGLSLLDSTGNGRTLTKVGTGVSLGTGKIGGSANFDGDEETYFTRSGSFLNGSRDEYSISAWVKTTVEDNFFIVDQATGDNWGGSSITLDMLSNGTAYGTIYYNDTPDYDRIFSSTSVNDGNWHHVAFTWKRTGSLKVYVDGTLDGSTSSSGNYSNVPTNNAQITERKARKNQYLYKHIHMVAVRTQKHRICKNIDKNKSHVHRNDHQRHSSPRTIEKEEVRSTPTRTICQL